MKILCVCLQFKYQNRSQFLYYDVSDYTAYSSNIIAYYKLSNWAHKMITPCCFLKLPVETARALQMSTAVNVLTVLTPRQPNKEDKLLVLVPPRADQILFFIYSSLYLKAITSVRHFIYIFMQIIVVFFDLSKEVSEIQTISLSCLPVSVPY